MKPARIKRLLIAWGLYLSVFVSGLACAFCHGQMAGLQLTGHQAHHLSSGMQPLAQAGSHSHGHHEHGDHTGHSDSSMNAVTGSGCAITSVFGSILVAALFGLIGLLRLGTALPLPTQELPSWPRYRWPASNPRASPAQLHSF